MTRITPVSFELYDTGFDRFAQELGGSFERYGFAVVTDTALDQQGIDAAIADDIDAELWRKFFMLAAMSAVSCMARASIGQILDSAPTRALAVTAALEAAAVGRAEGVNLPGDIEGAVLQQVNLMPRDGRPSMLEDLEAGRPLELPYFSGTLARLGRRHGIPTPIHDMALSVLGMHAGGASKNAGA